MAFVSIVQLIQLSMLQELKGKNVSIAMGTTDFSYVLKGEVLEVKDAWLKLQTKKNVEYIRVDAIVRVLS